MKLREIIKEAADPNLFRGLTVKLYHSEDTADHDQDDQDDGQESNYDFDYGPSVIKHYEILHQGKKVGELEWDDARGVDGVYLYNKTLPDLREYGYGEDGDEKALQEILNKFVQSKTFLRWSANIDKYIPLKGPTNDYRLRSNR